MRLQSCIFFCLATRVSNTVIKLSTSSSAMCCCLVPSVCESCQCLTRSLYVSFLLRAVLGRDLSLGGFFIQVTDGTSVCSFWSSVCLLPVLTSAMEGHEEQAHSGARRSVAALQLCLLCLPCTFWAAAFEGTETLFLASLITLLEAPEPLFATLYFFICFDPMDVLSNYLCFTGVLPVCISTKSHVRERQWGREVHEWLAVPSNKKIIKTSSLTVKFSVKGGAAHSQMWLQGWGVWVPLVLERACVLSQKIIESFLCILMFFLQIS